MISVQITVVFTQYNVSLIKTGYLYLRCPFFLMKHNWTNSFNRRIRFEWGIVCRRQRSHVFNDVA